MNKNTVYILQNDYESPMCKVHKGVGHTIKEWQRYFPKLSEEDFDIKSDWFKPTKDEPQWEILAFLIIKHSEIVEIGSPYVHNAEWHLKYPEEYSIYKVKRLSDGEVFSVGDSLDWMDEIKSIEIDDKFNGGMVFINNSQKSCLSTAKKAPKEEQVPIKVLGLLDGINTDNPPYGKYYTLIFNNSIPESKYQSIREAIEDVLNNKYKPWKMYQTGFTSEELLQAIRDAFHAGRSFDCWNVSSHQYAKFEDYINSLK